MPDLRTGRRLHARASQSQAVAVRCHRAKNPHEIGGAPTAPQCRQRRQRGVDLAPRLGGRSHTAAPCTAPERSRGSDRTPHCPGRPGRRTAPPGPASTGHRTAAAAGPGPAETGPAARCRTSAGDPRTASGRTAVTGRLSGGSGASMRSPSPSAVRSRGSAPHSSQSSTPGTSSALPAAMSSRIRSPWTATGESGARWRRAARPASAGTSRTSKRRPTRRLSGAPGAAGTTSQPSSFSYHRRT